VSLRTAQIVVLFLFVSSAAFTQPVTGLSPFGSFSGGPFDTINNANLNAHFEIPIINKAGRGQALTYSLTYDSSIWMPVYAGGTTTWTPTPLTTWGWGTATNAPGALMGKVTSTAVQNGCPTNPPLNNQWYYWITYSNFTYVDTSQTPHPVPGLTISDFQSGHGCGGGPPSSMTSATTDGSGYQVTAGTYAGAGYAYLVSAVKTNGTILGLVSGPTGPADSQDSNGNQITSSFSNGVITVTDTLGTPALAVSTGSPMTLSYTNPQGGTSHYTVNYTSKTVRTAFGCSGIAEYGPVAVNLVTSVVLPDQTQYTVTYETTPGYPSNVTGRIASITLPTGGTISYQYSGGSNGITCGDGTTATLARQTPDGTWTYAHTEPTAPNPWSTTITDPQGNVTSLSFQGYQPQPPTGGPVIQALYEVQRIVKQGASTTLLTVNTCYNGTASCTNTGVSAPIGEVRATSTLPGSANLQSQVITWYNGSGLPSEVDEYDYGTGGPGTLTRKTITNYNGSLGNIVDHPTSVTAYNSTGQTVAQTSYLYDEYTVDTPPGNTPQHVSVATARGNATSVTQTTGSTSLINHFHYFDTGNLETTIDVSGAQATYSYTTGSGVTSCGNSFATSVAVAGNGLPTNPPLTTTANWNCGGGVQLWAKDANGQQITTTYADQNFWRPTSVVDAASATANNYYSTYSDAQHPAAIETALNFNNNGSTAATRTTLDLLGRTHVSQRRQAPGTRGTGTYDSVETDYDVLGRPSRVTVPYAAAAGGGNSGGAATTTTYDALNRPLVVTDGGGGTASYSYSQNDVLVTVGPAAPSENTKRRQFEYL
jgi:hypothetical protein